MSARPLAAACLSAGLLAACMSATSDGDTAAETGRAGKGGSMARFQVVGDHLYALSGTSLHVYGIADPAAIAFRNAVEVGPGIETLFARGGYLYVGSETGMLLYDIGDRDAPAKTSGIAHFRSCDPVVVEGSRAFLTLRSGGARCWNGKDELQIYDVRDPYAPVLLRSYPMANPHGLGLDGDLLFLCDGYAGLKVYRVGADHSLSLAERVDGLETYDVIPDAAPAGAGGAGKRKLLLLVAREGLYQYDYTSSPMRELSVIRIGG